MWKGGRTFPDTLNPITDYPHSCFWTMLAIDCLFPIPFDGLRKGLHTFWSVESGLCFCVDMFLRVVWNRILIAGFIFELDSMRAFVIYVLSETHYYILGIARGFAAPFYSLQLSPVSYLSVCQNVLKPVQRFRRESESTKMTSLSHWSFIDNNILHKTLRGRLGGGACDATGKN